MISLGMPKFTYQKHQIRFRHEGNVYLAIRKSSRCLKSHLIATIVACAAFNATIATNCTSNRTPSCGASRSKSLQNTAKVGQNFRHIRAA